MALKHPKIEQLEQHCCEALQEDLNDPSLFTYADFDESEVERTGVSNYSYWRSTVRAFSKNKVAMFLLILMLAVVLFTFIQPLLPGQFDPFQVNNNPTTGLPLTSDMIFFISCTSFSNLKDRHKDYITFVRFSQRERLFPV